MSFRLLWMWRILIFTQYLLSLWSLPDERMAYEQSLKAFRDYNNTVQTAEWVGEEKGRAEGRAEGLAEGRKKEKVEIARRMLVASIDIDTISSVSGLSLDEIKELNCKLMDNFWHKLGINCPKITPKDNVKPDELRFRA